MNKPIPIFTVRQDDEILSKKKIGKIKGEPRARLRVKAVRVRYIGD